MAAYRKEKMEGQIRRLVSELLIKEIKDPRIGFATVTGVDLNKDFTEARVGISVLGTPRDMRKSLEGLQSSEGFIRHKVGKALGIRVMPKIVFHLDSSVAEGTRMVGLLNDLEAEEAERSQDEDNEDSPEEK
ncbi:MAG TPA: 30S ribosome-binding factor RbfA [Spirochaetota bacterium]|nr:30S ribosome-binding factor RbfA [Spirochaetota bacterium]HRZ27346.1 30S ribosome-binding factor RbfA [Spirochaetota bacterium]HSA14280.1 30S ribosome-binding factor RbfA [Spirochaetota bacterium]